jgi:hypothetical protein
MILTVYRALAYTGIGVTLLVILLSAARRVDSLPQGLRAEYFANRTWSPPSVVSTLDPQPSTERMSEAWRGSPPDVFSATWTGALLAFREGIYTFATISDDASSVLIDGRRVVDNGGVHAERLATGSIHLSAGVHGVQILYVQSGGAFHVELLWARGQAPLEPVPAWALRPRRVRSLWQAVPSLVRESALASLEWVWVGILVAAVAVSVWPAAVRLRRYLERHAAWPALAWILAGSLVLNVVGIGWGVPGRWVPNEIDPAYVVSALSTRFVGGWYEWYPPLHFYVLTLAISPLLLLEALGRLSLGSATGYTLALVACRLVSVAAGAGTVLAAALCGTQVFGKRAGAFAAAIVALTAPFLYYSKTANVDVPYLFWFGCSMVFYLRILTNLADRVITPADGAARASQRDSPHPESRIPNQVLFFVLFSACATFAVCTKDQAYALYALMPAPIIYYIWRANRAAGRPRPLLRALVDLRLVAAATTTVVLFALCHNLVFNAGGFVNHFRLLTGGTVVFFQVFEPTVSGHLKLLMLTVRLIQISLGWPLFLVSIAGMLIAAATARARRVAVWLVLPVVSYYLGVIDLVLYNYDRFILPIAFILAIFGGFAFDRWLVAERWRAIAAACVFAYTCFYSATVDVLMLGDSRYTVERWMKSNIHRDELVATSGLREYLPRIDGFGLVDVGTTADLKEARPAFCVLNADYARAVPPDTDWGRLIAGLHDGSLGYRLVFRYRRPSPWPWLPGAHPDLVGQRTETIVFSTLRNINPAIEVFERIKTPVEPAHATDSTRLPNATLAPDSTHPAHE